MRTERQVTSIFSVWHRVDKTRNSYRALHAKLNFLPQSKIRQGAAHQGKIKLSMQWPVKAKIAVALQDELGRVPKEAEINQVFLLTRVMYKAVLGLHLLTVASIA